MSRRCSRCKRENWPLHKRRGFLLCEHCLAVLEYGGFERVRFGIKNFFIDVGEWFVRIGKYARHLADRIRGVKHIEIDPGKVQYQAAKSYASKPKMVNLVRVGSSYQKTA